MTDLVCCAPYIDIAAVQIGKEPAHQEQLDVLCSSWASGNMQLCMTVIKEAWGAPWLCRM